MLADSSFLDVGPVVVSRVAQLIRTKLRFGIVIWLGRVSQDTVGEASSPVEENGRTGARHAAENGQAFAVNGTHNGAFVWRVGDDTRPFVGDGVGSASEGFLQFGAQIMREEARRLVALGFAARDACGVGTDHLQVDMSDEKGSTLTKKARLLEIPTWVFISGGPPGPVAAWVWVGRMIS